MRSSGLEPRWSSPPGDTITSVLRDRGMTPTDLTYLLGLSRQEIRDLLDGTLSITISLARILADTLGGSAEFWIARDAQYLDDRARVAADRWSGSFPIKQMADFGWIEPPTDWHERIHICMDFFSVGDVASFDEQYADIVDRSWYRTSRTYSLDKAAAAAWFRACELAADRIETLSAFNPTLFGQTLSEIRALTRNKRPESFLPRLVELCASSGVAVVLERAPDGFPASGAARIYQGRPLIQLSARYLSDDHLWFTFFHEAAHVLLHSLDSPFVDIDDTAEIENADGLELEANEYAMRILVGDYKFHSGSYSYDEVLQIALQLGISPGIVVGQLQHAGRVPRNYLNKLKRRYVWRGPNLETAQRN
jgi:HTH-type transcriptional regulator / antitoxin HigA